MDSRAQLQSELEQFLPNVYFQPPSNLAMNYPCIVYNKNGRNITFADNSAYLNRQGYQLTVIHRDPDNDVADKLSSHFQYCSINQEYVVDNLNHTTLTLYY